MTKPARHLAELEARPGGPWSPATCRWLSSAVRQHLNEGADLAHALGIQRADLQRARRNAHLDAAARTLKADTIREQCRELLRQILRFEARVLPNARDREEPDPRWSQCSTEIWRALRCGCELPYTVNGLEFAVKSARDVI